MLPEHSLHAGWTIWFNPLRNVWTAHSFPAKLFASTRELLVARIDAVTAERFA